MIAAAEPPYSGFVSRIAGKVNSADAFYRQNSAAGEKSLGSPKSIFSGQMPGKAVGILFVL